MKDKNIIFSPLIYGFHNFLAGSLQFDGNFVQEQYTFSFPD